MTSTEGIGRRPLVSVGVGDAVAVAGTRLVNVGETEVMKPKLELEPMAVALFPESRGVVAGTTTSINDDVRKQTSKYSFFLAPHQPYVSNSIDLPLPPWALTVGTSFSDARTNDMNQRGAIFGFEVRKVMVNGVVACQYT